MEYYVNTLIKKLYFYAIREAESRHDCISMFPNSEKQNIKTKQNKTPQNETQNNKNKRTKSKENKI